IKSRARRLEAKVTTLTSALGFVFPVWKIEHVTIWGRFEGKGWPKLTADTIGAYEGLLGTEYSPVTVIQDHDGETHLTPDDLGDPHTLFLAVDLAHPQDVLMALIEPALREAVNVRGKLLKRDPCRRRRIDKADFELAVYDLARQGESFKKIAYRLNR